MSYSPRSKRVLMVTSVLARGGCERQMFATVRGLLKPGYTIEIFKLASAAPGEPNFEAEFAALGVKSVFAAEFGDMTRSPEEDHDRHGLQRFTPILAHLNVVQLGLALEQVIKRFRPSVVHCWSEPSSAIGGLVATALDVPRIVVQLVNVSPFHMKWLESDSYREVYRLLLRNPNVRLLNISSANARNFEQWLDVEPGTVRLLRNGFCPDSLNIRAGLEAQECRQQLGIPSGAPTVGALMRFAQEKDPDRWLETASIVAAARPDVYFVLAGYGALSEQIVRKAEELGLSQRVILPGATIDVGAFYAAMDVFLMTSQFEGTPNTLIEAQAAGIPVVVPDVGGTSETVAHGLTGLLVADRTAAELADAVLRVLDDSALRQSAALHGPRFVSERFGWQRKIDETVAIYRNDPPASAVSLALAAAF